MEVIKEDDPVTLAEYAIQHKLLQKQPWKWAAKYVKEKKRINHMKHVTLGSKKNKQRVKYKFGARVPRTLREAYLLDKWANNTKWSDAIQKEVESLVETYSVFTIYEKGKIPPVDHTKIPLLWAFDIKFNGRYRARLVAGGHMTPEIDIEESTSSTTSLEDLRVVFVVTSLMNLKVITADVGHAYLQAFTKEKVYTIAGPEFGVNAGKVLVIKKALYGLKTSGARWHDEAADTLRAIGFCKCKAGNDMWIREQSDHNEFILVYVDDLMIFSRTPNPII
jgi:hypothetical protein